MASAGMGMGTGAKTGYNQENKARIDDANARRDRIKTTNADGTINQAGAEAKQRMNDYAGGIFANKKDVRKSFMEKDMAEAEEQDKKLAALDRRTGEARQNKYYDEKDPAMKQQMLEHDMAQAEIENKKRNEGPIKYSVIQPHETYTLEPKTNAKYVSHNENDIEYDQLTIKKNPTYTDSTEETKTTEKPGFLKTADDLILERDKRIKAEKETTSTTQNSKTATPSGQASSQQNTAEGGLSLETEAQANIRMTFAEQMKAKTGKKSDSPELKLVEKESDTAIDKRKAI
jgi:hypothetical protein